MLNTKQSSQSFGLESEHRVWIPELFRSSLLEDLEPAWHLNIFQLRSNLLFQVEISGCLKHVPKNV